MSSRRRMVLSSAAKRVWRRWFTGSEAGGFGLPGARVCRPPAPNHGCLGPLRHACVGYAPRITAAALTHLHPGPSPEVGWRGTSVGWWRISVGSWGDRTKPPAALRAARLPLASASQQDRGLLGVDGRATLATPSTRGCPRLWTLVWTACGDRAGDCGCRCRHGAKPCGKKTDNLGHVGRTTSLTCSIHHPPAVDENSFGLSYAASDGRSQPVIHRLPTATFYVLEGRWRVRARRGRQAGVRCRDGRAGPGDRSHRRGAA
jgi:hypothetical protein